MFELYQLEITSTKVGEVVVVVAFTEEEGEAADEGIPQRASL